MTRFFALAVPIVFAILIHTIGNHKIGIRIMQIKLSKIISARLKMAREQAGLTLTQVAERVGYAQPTLSGIENGHDQPSKRLLEKWIEALQLNDTWVKTGEGQIFQGSGIQRPTTREGDLAAPLRARIRKIRQHAADLLQEVDKMEQELRESQTGHRS